MAGFKKTDRKKVLSAIKPLFREGLKYAEMADRLNSMGLMRPYGDAWDGPHLNTFCNTWGFRRNKGQARAIVKDRKSIPPMPSENEALFELVMEMDLETSKKITILKALLK